MTEYANESAPVAVWAPEWQQKVSGYIRRAGKVLKHITGAKGCHVVTTSNDEAYIGLTPHIPVH